jgi:hypothetical protein
MIRDIVGPMKAAQESKKGICKVMLMSYFTNIPSNYAYLVELVLSCFGSPPMYPNARLSSRVAA